jgi:hypothetical protein
VLQLGSLQIRAVWDIRRGSLRVIGRTFDYIEVIFAADALDKIHRQFLTPQPDLHVVG